MDEHGLEDENAPSTTVLLHRSSLLAPNTGLDFILRDEDPRLRRAFCQPTPTARRTLTGLDQLRLTTPTEPKHGVPMTTNIAPWVEAAYARGRIPGYQARWPPRRIRHRRRICPATTTYGSSISMHWLQRAPWRPSSR